LVLPGADTDHGYRAEVERAAREAGVADRVHVVGNIDPMVDVPDLLARARLMVTPSTHEPFGLCLLEGWAAGLPVLFSDASGPATIAEGLEDRRCMLPLDEDAWVERLRETLESEATRRRFAEDGLRLVHERYTWGAAARHLAELYGEVLTERRG